MKFTYGCNWRCWRLGAGLGILLEADRWSYCWLAVYVGPLFVTFDYEWRR